MPLEEYNSIDCIKFRYGDAVDIMNEKVEEFVEVNNTRFPSIDIMLCSNTVWICNMRLDTVEDICGFFNS